MKQSAVPILYDAIIRSIVKNNSLVQAKLLLFTFYFKTLILETLI
jgi:hypothetical protein